MINWQQLQAQLPLLDEHQLQRLAQELGQTVTQRLLQLFIDDSQQLAAQLQQAFLQEDWLSMAAHCHSLKSACGSYGALRCQYLSEKLEDSCKLQEVERITQQFNAWQTALAATLELVKERVAKPPNT